MALIGVFTICLFERHAISSIGSDQGLLGAPVALKTLALAPAERADMVVDFADHRGEQIVLKNDSFVRDAIPRFSQKVRKRVPCPPSCGRFRKLPNRQP